MKQPALGNTISTLRNQKGLTQKELAEACTTDIRTIQRIEAGEVAPRMHTIRLISNALGCETSVFITTADAATSSSKPSGGDLKYSLFAGMVFSLNAIPVVFDLITHSFNSYFHVCTLIINAVSCIFFFWGFYLIGRQNNNQLMAITSLLAMVLLPLVNVLYLLNAYNVATYIIYILLCINDIVGGIGFLTEGYKRKGRHRGILYSIAGFTIIIQTTMLLGSDSSVIATGLILSLLCNMVTTRILYLEYNGGKSMEAPDQVKSLA